MGSVVGAPGLQSTGSAGVVHGLSCSAACGIFRDQESNPCLLHWQADSLPLSHQGSPASWLLLMNTEVALDTGPVWTWGQCGRGSGHELDDRSRKRQPRVVSASIPLANTGHTPTSKAKVKEQHTPFTKNPWQEYLPPLAPLATRERIGTTRMHSIAFSKVLLKINSGKTCKTSP